MCQTPDPYQADGSHPIDRNLNTGMRLNGVCGWHVLLPRLPSPCVLASVWRMGCWGRGMELGRGLELQKALRMWEVPCSTASRSC